MQNKSVLAAFACVAILVSSSLFAAVYVVPPDRALVHAAESVVVGTVVGSHCEFGSGGAITTVIDVDVETVLKGSPYPGNRLRLFELGGEIGSRQTIIFDGPQYVVHSRYLIFTDRDNEGRPATLGLALGQFTLQPDSGGRLLAVHPVSLFGFNDNLDPYSEQLRDADGFVAYIRSIVASNGVSEPRYFIERSQPIADTEHSAAPSATYTIASYLGYEGAVYRWPTPSYSFNTMGSQPGVDGPGAASAATGTWNGAGPSNVSISISGTTSQSGGLHVPDGQNTVLFNDPNNEFPQIAGQIAAVGGVNAESGTQNLPDGSGAAGIPTEVDIVVAKNFPLGSCLSTILAHEMGHTLGFRHSDSCSSSPCDSDSNALMTGGTISCGSGLKAWDLRAVSTVYGSGPPPCTAPSITTQPQSSTITAGNSATLSVGASGTTPLTYQWYIGTPSNTSSPFSGGTNSSISVAPSTTTTYWVRVTGQCGTPADSAGATVTVNPAACTPPSITTPPSGSTITSGSSALLSVGASGTTPLNYQWYAGNPPSTLSPVGTGQSILVSPSSTTSYWVRVTGQCGTPADSAAVIVTVTASTCPVVTVGIPVATAISGGFQLSVTASTGSGGGSLTYSWFSNGNFAGSGNPLTVTPQSATQYNVVVSNACGSQSASPAITVTPAATCNAPAISSITASPTSITAGAASTLTVVATGTSLNYQWYAGAPGDTSKPVINGNSATISVAPAQTTSYWVLVSSGCGATPATSPAVTVTVTAACTTPTITTPASEIIPPGGSAALAASAAGTAPLHYQWYQGAAETATTPVGSDSATYSTAALTSTTQYWVRVTNGCGSSASSGTITITIQPARRRPARR
jgi:Ig-like domain CHU_C associated